MLEPTVCFISGLMAGAVGDDTDPDHPFSLILLMADMVQWEITRIATTMIHYCDRRMLVWGQGPKDPGKTINNSVFMVI